MFTSRTEGPGQLEGLTGYDGVKGLGSVGPDKSKGKIELKVGRRRYKSEVFYRRGPKRGSTRKNSKPKVGFVVEEYLREELKKVYPREISRELQIDINNRKDQMTELKQER